MRKKHTQVSKQTGVARMFFAEFFGMFSTFFNKILLDAQIKEYNKKLTNTPNAQDNSLDKNKYNTYCITITHFVNTNLKHTKSKPIFH